ncbi:hypothetical protein BX616_008008, partial [Lobosporangium transversale]
WFCTSWCWSLCRIDRIGGRIRDWYCRRRVCPRICLSAKAICSNGVGTDFRRSFGTVRNDCGVDSEHKGSRN